MMCIVELSNTLDGRVQEGTASPGVSRDGAQTFTKNNFRVFLTSGKMSANCFPLYSSCLAFHTVTEVGDLLTSHLVHSTDTPLLMVALCNFCVIHAATRVLAAENEKARVDAEMCRSLMLRKNGSSCARCQVST